MKYLAGTEKNEALELIHKPVELKKLKVLLDFEITLKAVISISSSKMQTPISGLSHVFVVFAVIISW